MNRSKRALLSMIVISSVFCIVAIFNIKLPLHSAMGADATTDSSKDEAVIHSFSYNVNQAQVFCVNQYLSHAEAEAYEDDDTEQVEEESSVAELAMARTAAAPAEDADTAQLSLMSTANADAPADSSTTDENADGSATDENADASATDQSVNNSPDEAIDAQPSETVEAEEEPEVVEPKYADIGISIAKEFVNIRKEPSTDAKVLGKLYRNAACTIISKESGWYYVESGSITGYAKAEYIKTGIPDDELVEKYGTIKISVEVDGLNVRKEPTTESKKLTCIYKGEKYPVIEKSDDWTKIHLEDDHLDGYVLAEHTEEIVTFQHAVSKAEEDKLLQLKAEERAKAETVIIQGNGYSYTNQDLKLLACLVHAEAGNQSYEGRLAVANVVLNRMKSSKFPDTMKGVIYQSGQFSVAKSGSLQKQLDNYDNYTSKSQKLTIKAAKDALEGANNIGKRMYFHTVKAAIRDGHHKSANSVKLDDHIYW